MSWKWEEPSNWLGLSGRVVNENHEPICQVDLAGWGKRKGRKIGEAIAALPDLLEACEKAEKFIDAILGFYGQGLEVAGWHLNGDTELLDNFIDDNSDGEELRQLREAIAKVNITLS